MIPTPARYLASLALATVVVVACAGQGATTPSAAIGSRVDGAEPRSTAPATLAPAASPDDQPLLPPPPSPPAPTPSTEPTPATDPPPSTDPPRATAALDPPPRPGRFAMDLYRRGDFVSQATVEWCVPASILTMANVIEDGRRRHLPDQSRLDRISRSLSSPRLVGAGSEPEGWAKTLVRLGYGPYAVVAKGTRAQAIRAAARAIRLTGRPVGLLIWRGAHAWVMTGFEATADPAWTDDFRVTRVRVSDPWYPRPSAAWGRTRGPDARVGPARLRSVYLPWRRPLARYVELDGRFVLVLPTRHRHGG